MITAVVLLKSASALDTAQQAFARLGFSTTPVAGGSLLISGSRALFRDKFKLDLRVDEKSGVEVVGAPAGNERVLPVDKLPPSVQAYVAGIEFEAPIDFGPTDY